MSMSLLTAARVFQNLLHIQDQKKLFHPCGIVCESREYLEAIAVLNSHIELEERTQGALVVSLGGVTIADIKLKDALNAPRDILKSVQHWNVAVTEMRLKVLNDKAASSENGASVDIIIRPNSHINQ